MRSKEKPMVKKETDEAGARSFPEKLSDALRNPQQKPRSRPKRHRDTDSRLFDAAMFVSMTGETFEEAARVFFGDPAKQSDVGYQFYVDFRRSSTDRTTPNPVTFIEGVLAGGYQLCNACGALIKEGQNCLAAPFIGRIERPDNPPTPAQWDFLCEKCGKDDKKLWKKRWKYLLDENRRFLLSGGRPPADDLRIYEHLLRPRRPGLEIEIIERYLDLGTAEKDERAMLEQLLSKLKQNLKDMPPGTVAMAPILHSYDFGHVRKSCPQEAYTYGPASRFWGGEWRSIVPCNVQLETYEFRLDGTKRGILRDEDGNLAEKQLPADEDELDRFLIHRKSGAKRNGKAFLPYRRPPSPNMDVPDSVRELLRTTLPVTEYRPVECSKKQINELAAALSKTGVFPEVSDFGKLAARAIASLIARDRAVDARAFVWPAQPTPRPKPLRLKGNYFRCWYIRARSRVDFPLYGKGQLEEYEKREPKPKSVSWPPPAHLLPSPLVCPWLYAIQGDHFVVKSIRKIPHEISGKKVVDWQKRNGPSLKANSIRGWMVYPLKPSLVKKLTPTSGPCWWGRTPKKRRIRDCSPFLYIHT